jgi:hypothetical protein
VTPDRARGLQLYALAAAVLVGGGGWFLASAPYTGADPRVKVWREAVTRALPDVQPQVAADTVALVRGMERAVDEPVPGGSVTLTMVCAGVGQVRVRLSATGDDTGRPVPCTDNPQPVTLTFGLGSEFFMSITAETDAAVFRWRLTPASTE